MQILLPIHILAGTIALLCAALAVSSAKGKKFSVKVKVNNKKGFKIIHFGATGYDDFRSGTATASQRRSYLARAKGIRNKNGE